MIPVKLRRSLEISNNDLLEIYVLGEQIILMKYKYRCIFCGDRDKLVRFKGKDICNECLGFMNKLS
ncbi:AbrB/MazE/SpoVT family DNA-binding domain-containing protein [Microaerobacter geothermalis]|nr:AbrB/MazE/SpoVT family DNA-binding domain-containing protein [Microaerobacter geothermalis]